MSQPEPNRGWAAVGEYVVIFIVAFALAYVLQNYISGHFVIDQHSMEPTLYENDRVLINRLLYRLSDPKRGDIVILIDPTGSKSDFVKRIIALPGDVVEMKSGDVYVNQKLIHEDYIAKDKAVDTLGPLRVTEGEYFVMGDNRTVSMDSRRFGYVPRNQILGKVMVVFWPPNHSRVPK